MKEFTERFASLSDAVYGILAEIGIVCAIMLVAGALGWALVRWVS